MKTILFALFITTLSYAQTVPNDNTANDDMIEIGVKASRQLRSNAETIGIQVKYISHKEGIMVPVSIEFGQDIQKYTAGVGITATDLEETVRYSVAGALAKMNFGNSYQDINPEDRNRFGILLQQELLINMSKHFSAGVNFDLDVFNFIRVASAGGPFDHGQPEYEKNVASKKKSSMTSAGISIKYNIFKK